METEETIKVRKAGLVKGQIWLQSVQSLRRLIVSGSPLTTTAHSHSGNVKNQIYMCKNGMLIM